MQNMNEWELPFGHGYFDLVESKEGLIHVNGWMVFPRERLDGFLLSVNETVLADSVIRERADVEKVFPFLPYSRYSGFDISARIDEPAPLLNVCVVGMQGDKHIAKLKTLYSRQLLEETLSVDARLLKRVTGQENLEAFWQSGLKTFQDYWELACKHLSVESIRRILDWGCGPGRLTWMLTKLTTAPEIHGCDIDSDAISWCEQNMPRAEFRSIPPFPPTRYSDDCFDLVIGNSIFTHLKRDVQISWLQEIRRILREGGLLLASVHGEFATYLKFPDSADRVLRKGIFDEVKDGILDGVAPKDYYRGTYQSRAYTQEVFGKYFEILDYIERGCYHFQDVVVMRKR